MSWAQKDDGSWTDSRLCALSDRAYRLHDNCWTYAADKMTDGELSRDEVARVAAMFNLTDPRQLDQAIHELITWKVWTATQNPGYAMVRWLEQNRSREDNLKALEANREKQRRWRERSAKGRRK